MQQLPMKILRRRSWAMKNSKEKDYKFASFSELIKKTEEDLVDSKESQVMEIPF